MQPPRAGFDHHRLMPELVSVGAFRSTKSAVKMHTLLDLRGNISSFTASPLAIVHDSTSSTNPLQLAPTSNDRGYLDFFRLHRIHLFEPLCYRAKATSMPVAFTLAR